MSTVRTGREGESYTDGLDHILSNTEFETTQQETQIQNELDKINAHEKEIEEKEREIEEFARVTADMETRKEKSFKQLQLNRDNIASLKHTVTVLDEHLEALRKKHEIMVQKTRDTRSQYNSAVDKYEEKWERFQSIYNDMRKAKDLTGKRDTLQQIKGEEAALDAMIADSEKALRAMKPEGWNATVQWVLQIATVRVETEAIRGLVSSTKLASLQAQQELEGKSAGKDEQMVVGTEGEGDKEEGGGEKGEEGGGNKPGNATGLGDGHVESMDVGSDLAPLDKTPETSPPQQVPSVSTRSNHLPANMSPTTLNLASQEKPNKVGEGQVKGSREGFGQGRGFGVFVRPYAPPPRFTATQPPHKQQSNSAANTLPPVPSLLYTKPATLMQSTAKTPSIPPRFQLRSPKPPVPPSPRLQTPSPSPPPTTRTTTKPVLELPKFSFRLPTSGSTSTTSFQPSSLPQNSTGRVQPTTAKNVGVHTPKSDNNSPTFTPQLPSTNRVSTAPHRGSTSTSVLAGGRSQYRLMMPPKPTPPSVRPPPVTTLSGNSTTPLPMKLFALPQEPQQQTSRALQSKHPQPLVGKISTTPQPINRAEKSVQPTNPAKNSISRQPSIDKDFPPVLTAPNPQVARCPSHQEPQKSYDARMQTSNGGQSYHRSSDIPEAERIPVQQNQLEDMELGGGERMEGEEQQMSAVGESSFSLTSTSIDFGEQSVDFEGGSEQLQMFGVQTDDSNMLSMSQTDPFFNETQSGESYGFMTLNDGGDPSSEGDFFSQFGKATTTSGEGGGFFF